MRKSLCPLDRFCELWKALDIDTITPLGILDSQEIQSDFDSKMLKINTSLPATEHV